MRGRGEAARYVEGGREGYKERFVGGARINTLRYRIDAVTELGLRRAEGLE